MLYFQAVWCNFAQIPSNGIIFANFSLELMDNNTCMFKYKTVTLFFIILSIVSRKRVTFAHDNIFATHAFCAKGPHQLLNHN